MITHFPLPKRLIFAMYGRWLAFAYACQTHFWAYSRQSWLQGLALVLLLWTLFGQTATAVRLFAAAIFVALWFGFGWAKRRGYVYFVADPARVMASHTAVPLAAEQRISLQASGPYAVSDREETVLLRPASYWQSPNGEHGLMVSQPDQKYLYQFFPPTAVQQLVGGWLLFGPRPWPTLAVTFINSWGPAQGEDVVSYMVTGGGNPRRRRPQHRTIYLSSADTAVEAQLWAALQPPT